ncbi:DeoR/GlpR family DNA-binding transcription regulator [Shimia ponticola]|uniref:DeoR/GlpR family DNA-binding transcription regulator n=1 Tax=Shimia ponticola TaxID=2582893 RepID=UPI0011BD8A09|nr:DeoR/GlpR family DNA-binding transcription regulator [Shimia ponticola]
MNKNESLSEPLRHARILSAARSAGQVNATRLAHEIGVTPQTIRTDLRKLVDAGLLERVHGGAILPSGVRHIGYADRQALNRDRKARIGARVSRLIPNDSSLFLNIGTTTEAVAKELLSHSNMMVVTNNLNVANILAQNESCEVIVAGGQLRRSDGGLVGDAAAATIERYKVDFAVIGTSALDQAGDLLDFDAAEVRVAQTILRQARSSILAADHTKFTRQAPVRIANLAELDVFVTDQAPSERVQTVCKDAGTRILIS